ncbi:MAG: UDP-N-acetyl-D-galactosamine dehydrogenase [Myxococcota bacterium]|jgi:UDP-N-acetyl-D-galactosamine dehydrogenase
MESDENMGPDQTRVAIVGLGYIGLPTAVAFGRTHRGTVGYDIDETRIAELNADRDRNGDVSSTALSAAEVAYSADPQILAAANCYLMAVPTPLGPEHEPDLSAVIAATRTIGAHLAVGDLVVVESTVYPGVTENLVGPLLATVSGLSVATDFQLGFAPERINPGDAEHALERVVKVVSGTDAATTERVAALYAPFVSAGVYRAASVATAEMAKLVENTQRDLNIALMNEVALVCDRLGLRTRDVLDAARTKWNFLDFEPGLVGGHCIGVDPYYLTAAAQRLGYHPEVILAGRRINDHIGTYVAQRTIKLLTAAGVPLGRDGGARVGILGATFKANFPDLRNSRVRDIVDELREFGVEPLIHDPWARDAKTLARWGVTRSTWEELAAPGTLDALIIAVKHDVFVQRAPSELLAGLKPDGVVIDVKSILDPASLPKGLTYWSL